VSTSVAEINFNGFASVGGGYYSAEDTASGYQGYDQDTFTADPAIRFGLQVSAPINDKVMATGQLLAKGDDNYQVESEWAYLTYAANDDWDVRVGRLRSPFFPYSDFLDVGYAYPWITPPAEIYRFLFTTVEGIDTLYRGYVSGWDYTLQGYYGRLTDDTRLAGEDVELDLQDFAGVNITLTRDWLTLRASYNRAEASIETPSSLETALLDPLRTAGFGGVADDLEVQEEDPSFWGVSALVDYEDWLFTTEYTELLAGDQSLISDDQAWYVLVGRRINEFTLHATYFVQEDDPDFSILDPIAGTPFEAGARALISKSETKGVTLGLRYDFAPATAFKIEVTDVEFDNADVESNGMLLNFAIDTVF